LTSSDESLTIEVVLARYNIGFLAIFESET
jgi:hypothetical protein